MNKGNNREKVEKKGTGRKEESQRKKEKILYKKFS